ncbi:hypothetical protein N474_17810 [Pseudoalteromonas luteoviolacea CPMOR-2]|uniref:Uncharacterized protein n=1 Tax=Pseudoalteromonas luteoviolacea DSM 6061 TaxID=1365250 RepID=A0A166VD21_9GAMM|nr:hypothetical protein [Pseudoalteromonas luteoviolacea]KZN32519.1 hypothetical protein N475_21965 [Pseudoalteromonas luteoviolacea DSM 6061]KZN54661.1 hypothetical protein N474_17810 [Pseudoalteromonas luteoviolacea CPMOR-2]MBE0386150.1 hypothetical protein [Pseudoalteromonas luteoviolacea DSM 6061]
MKKLMLKLLGTHVTKPKRCSLVSPIWQNTGEVFYLLNTLQLRYRSQYGNVSVDSFDLQELARESDDLHSKLVCEFGKEFTVSVCAVGWEKFGKQTRVKAIDNAAIFRFNLSLGVQSQAIFQHQFNALDEVGSSDVSLANGNDVYKYNDIHLSEFITQLLEANKRIHQDRVKCHGITGENFHKDIFDRVMLF